MVTLIVNPVVVTLDFGQTALLGTGIVEAKDDNGVVVATIEIVHSMQDARLRMRDNRTDEIYESEPVDKGKTIDFIFDLLEYMLNQANLTYRQRISKSDNLNPPS